MTQRYARMYPVCSRLLASAPRVEEVDEPRAAGRSRREPEPDPCLGGVSVM